MKILLSCLALALLVALALFVRGLGDELAIPIRGLGTEEEARPQAARLTETAGSPAEATDEARTPAELEDGSRLEMLVLAGTVVAISSEGERREELDGQINFRLQTTDGAQYAQTPVERGRWRLTIVEGPGGQYRNPVSQFLPALSPAIQSASIKTYRVLLAGTQGTLEYESGGENLAFGNEEVAVVFRELAPFRLYVTDAETGAPLKEVTVMAAHDGALDGDLPIHKQFQHLLAQSAASPIAIPLKKLDWSAPVEHRMQRTFGGPHAGWFVGSPGYAWRVVPLTVKDEEEFHMELEWGATLDVSLAGATPPVGTEVRVFKPGHAKPVASRSSKNMSFIRFEGLAERNYRVSAEVGAWDEPPLLLAETELNLRAGDPNKLELKLHSAPELELTTLQGSVFVPRSWADEKYWLAFDLQDLALDGSNAHHVVSEKSLTSLGGSGVNYSFELKDLQVGTYSLRVNPIGYGYEFQLSPGEINQIGITLPELCEVTVLVRDETTQLPAETSTLAWRQPNFSGRYLISKRAKRAAGEEKFRFRVPAGTLTVKSPQGRYTAAETTVQAEEGLEIVLSVRPLE